MVVECSAKPGGNEIAKAPNIVNVVNLFWCATCQVRTEAKDVVLEEQGLSTLPPYSPDLAPCDFWLLSTIKKELKGRRSGSDEELQEAAMDAIDNILIQDFRNFIGKW